YKCHRPNANVQPTPALTGPAPEGMKCPVCITPHACIRLREEEGVALTHRLLALETTLSPLSATHWPDLSISPINILCVCVRVSVSVSDWLRW
ncbi:hypothetical protein WUBG_03413, partial [Wuchereria bancrofti]